MTDLNQAIQLIRQGQKFEAQRILQEIIKTEPKNIPAWFWYVETCATTERRIQVLETCLKMNPGNLQVEQALQTFRNSQPPVPAPPKVEPPAYQSNTPEPQKNDDLYSYTSFRSDSFEQTQSYEEDKSPAYDSPLYEYETFRTNSSVKEESQKKQPWEMDLSTYEDNSMLAKSKKVRRSYSAFDVWLTALTSQDEKSYADLLEDPEAGLERAFSWVAIAGLITALTVPVQYFLNPNLGELLDIPELQRQVGNMTPNAFIIILTMISFVTAPIGAILNLALSGGIQNLLARFFGGGGNFKRTAYALSAFLAPMAVVTSLVAIVPVAGSCLSFPLGIYSFILNVRALKASHSLTNGAAIGVLLAPSILVIIFGCLFLFMSGTSLSSS